jgi:hypothetical protein
MSRSSTRILLTAALAVPLYGGGETFFVASCRGQESRTTATPQTRTQPPHLDIPAAYRHDVTTALERAGDNAAELVQAIQAAPASQREAVCFLVANMPDVDLRSLQASFLRENVGWAFEARARLPWGNDLPEELFLNYVLPYASVNERRDNWRKDFFQRFFPVVRECQTPAQAAQKLNREMFAMVGVQYHATRRPKPDQSPYESIAAGYASCTGLSVLLVDACRAVCVPARLTGTPCWTTKAGNHNWVEIWDGQWYFMGAAEPDPEGLNRAWFVADAAKATATDPLHAIYATSFRQTHVSFPLAWDPSLTYVPARDVTKFYTMRKTVRIRALDRPAGRPAVAEVTLRLDDELYARGRTPGSASETETALEFELPAGETFAVEIKPARAATLRTGLTTTPEDPQDVVFFLSRD